MRKKLLTILLSICVLGLLFWYLTPFSYTLGEDVELNISVEGRLITVDGEAQREALIGLIEGLDMKRRPFGGGNIQTKDYIFLRANCQEYPYLGFHFSRQDVTAGGRTYSRDTEGNAIRNPREIILYLEQLIAGTENGK